MFDRVGIRIHELVAVLSSIIICPSLHVMTRLQQPEKAADRCLWKLQQASKSYSKKQIEKHHVPRIPSSSFKRLRSSRLHW
jgi:hypothetical protein